MVASADNTELPTLPELRRGLRDTFAAHSEAQFSGDVASGTDKLARARGLITADEAYMHAAGNYELAKSVMEGNYPIRGVTETSIVAFGASIAALEVAGFPEQSRWMQEFKDTNLTKSVKVLESARRPNADTISVRS